MSKSGRVQNCDGNQSIGSVVNEEKSTDGGDDGDWKRGDDGVVGDDAFAEAVWPTPTGKKLGEMSRRKLMLHTSVACCVVYASTHCDLQRFLPTRLARQLNMYGERMFMQFVRTSLKIH